MIDLRPNSGLESQQRHLQLSCSTQHRAGQDRPDVLRLKMRQERTLPRIQNLKTRIDAQSVVVLPKSAIAQAID